MGSKFFRKISDPVAWASYEEHAAWKSNDCPGEMLSELYDSQGISVWSAGSGEDSTILRLIAVLAFDMKSIPQQYAGIVFDESIVKEAGLTMKKTPMRTACQDVSDSHFDISGVTTLRFAKWSAALLRTGETKVFLRGEIVARMAKLQNDAEILPTRAPREASDLFGFLWKNSYLVVRG
jgi:hypothetical protein